MRTRSSEGMTAEWRPGRLESALLALLVLGLTLGLLVVRVVLTAFTGPVRFLSLPMVGVAAVVAVLAVGVVYAVLVGWRGLGAGALGLHVARGTLHQGVTGFGLGAGAALAAFAVAWAAGGYVVRPVGYAAYPGLHVLLAGFGLIVALAVFEEVTMRAGLVGLLARAWPWWVAVLLPAVAFALFHLGNAGANWLSTANTVMAGVVLGLLFLHPAGRPRVPALGLPTGFHVGWNYTLGWVLCEPVSGLRVPWNWFEARAVDPLWAGGAYGLEAGLATTLVYGALAAWWGLRVLLGLRGGR